MPIGRCSAVTPPACHAASLPYQLRDAREPPIWLDIGHVDPADLSVHIRVI